MTALADLGFAAVRFVTDLGGLTRFGGADSGARRSPRRCACACSSTSSSSWACSRWSSICVCGLAVGMVLSLQGYTTLVRFGAEQSLGRGGWASP